MEKIQKQILKQMQKQMDVAQESVVRMQELAPDVLNATNPAAWKKLIKDYNAAIKESSDAFCDMAGPDFNTVSALGETILDKQREFMAQRKQTMLTAMEQMMEHQRQYLAAIGLSSSASSSTEASAE